ncbi:energy transducer TonB family protein [Methylorubrum populi]|uniref:energy transducer TonB family protein n=1 Tax=Methylorubrum populi TaxID=223967 RepID=UPI0012FFB81D|nr:energy transducer TonB [Methylorubrum populi]
MSSYKLRLHQAIGDRARRIRNRSTTDGTATLKLVIAASGEVTASEIRASSGSPYIDGLVLKAVPVGSKLLPIPDELGSSTIAVVVPLRFTPRNR